MSFKVEFPVNINSSNAVYDIHYGHVSRPTHRNTTWDSAKYVLGYYGCYG